MERTHAETVSQAIEALHSTSAIAKGSVSEYDAIVALQELNFPTGRAWCAADHVTRHDTKLALLADLETMHPNTQWTFNGYLATQHNAPWQTTSQAAAAIRCEALGATLSPRIVGVRGNQQTTYYVTCK